MCHKTCSISELLLEMMKLASKKSVNSTPPEDLKRPFLNTLLKYVDILLWGIEKLGEERWPLGTSEQAHEGG